MKSENIFEIAVRTKMRFPFKGMVTVEDLWDLSVENLDLIFKTLNSRLKEASEESLLNEKSSADELLDIQIRIVKHIVNAKLAEQVKRKQALLHNEQKQKIMSILSKKQDADLENKSVEELEVMLGTFE